MAVNQSPGASNVVLTDPVTGGGSVSGTGSGADNQAQVPSGDPAALAFDAAMVVIQNEQSGLESFVVQPTGTGRVVVPHSSDDIVKAMGGVLKLAAVRPVYASIVDVGTTAALVDRIETGTALVNLLEILVVNLKNTNRASLKAGYAIVRTAYNYSEHNDQSDATAQSFLAPAQALFAKAPKATVADVKAGTSTVKKAKAQARSNNAGTVANSAQQDLDQVVQGILAGAPAPVAAGTTAPATGSK